MISVPMRPSGSPTHSCYQQVSTHKQPPMAESVQKPEEQQDSFFIIGKTSNGRQFRPSDWAERLCGVMACFKPEGTGGGRDAHLQFSPYVTPTTIEGFKSVIVNGKLRQ